MKCPSTSRDIWRSRSLSSCWAGRARTSRRDSSGWGRSCRSPCRRRWSLGSWWWSAASWGKSVNVIFTICSCSASAFSGDMMKTPFIIYDNVKALDNRRFKQGNPANRRHLRIIRILYSAATFRCSFTWQVASGWWGGGAGGGDRSAWSGRTSRTRAASTPGIQPSIHYLS